MASPPKQNEAFFREVDEELRRDQMLGFFGRYGKLIALAVVLFLAAVGGYLWWQHQQRTAAERQGEEFAAILVDLEAGKVQPNDPRLNKLIDETDSYGTQARFLKAGLAAEKDQPAEAISIYGRLAADGDVAQVYRDAALVRQTALEYDRLDPGKVIERLKPLAVQGNAWFGSAGEMVGIAYIRQGKPQLAVPIFVALAKDERVPQSIRMRAGEIAVSLGADPGLASK